MSTYEAPAITELGSVADFTAGQGRGPVIDGWFDTRASGGGGTPTS